MSKCLRLLGVLCIPAAGFIGAAHACGGQSEDAAKSLASIVALRLKDIETAWNFGDTRALLSQYDPSMVAILEPNFLNYTEYKRSIIALMAESDRPVMKLEINTVKALGADYALVNGRLHSTAHGGPDVASRFTVIYHCSGGQWKVIYAHS